MRLKTQFIITWILTGVTISLVPFLFFIQLPIVIIWIAVFSGVSISAQYLLQRKLFEEIHGTKSWERVPLKQFKNELLFSSFIGVVQVMMLYGIGYFLIPTSYDFNQFKIFAWLVGLIQPFVLNFLYHLFYLMQQNGYLKKETQSFKQLSSITQKKSLQDLVSPHFLFNSLNTAASITHDEPEEAVEFVEKLSDLYEFILKNNENQLIELSEELEIVEKYGFLIRTRFGKYFQIKMNIPEEYYNALIPPLTLQNLVENAAKHNAVTRKKPLHLKVFVEGDYIVVENNLNPKKTFSNESTNLGLNYIKTTIAQFSQFKINIEQTDEYFKVEIPLIYPSTI